MAERGGTTTQSGILYQNSVTALYLGRLCDNIPRPNDEAVISVRVEALTEVDDTVVTFADGHCLFIQAKENIRDSDEAYTKLWKDFEAQFWNPKFRRGLDRILLHTGDAHDEHRALRELAERAATSNDHVEWLNRATGPQPRLVRKIRGLFKPEHAGDEELFSIFRHVDVEIRPRRDIERDMVPYWMPRCNREPVELFRLLRDRVGAAGRVRGSFISEDLRASLIAESGVVFVQQPSISDLRERVRDCGAGLEQHRHSFGAGGKHLRRAVVGEIVEWATNDTSGIPGQNVATLLDHAGAGKTVAMRDVLLDLQDAQVVILGIKADHLSGISSHEELREALRLPDSVERILERLTGQGPVALLIDQLDALSLSLARDQKALNVVLDLVARVRRIPGVRVILSCRAFDLNNDPKLKSIDSGKNFHLTPLSGEEVREVLEATRINYERLDPATRELLQVPLHLDLLMRATEGLTASEGGISDVEGLMHEIKSLQDLYALLWHNVVLKEDPQAPPETERGRVLYLLTESMDQQQRTAVSRPLFSGIEGEYLKPALRWLMSERIILPAGGRDVSAESGADLLTFLHQTFFDYCYAKAFVEGRKHLYETIQPGEQGLFDRPKVIQVLTYLRGTDTEAYLRELGKILNAPAGELRFHLRDHVLRWFGSLQDSTDHEWLVAQRLLLNRERRRQVLSVMQGNIGWFRRLKQALSRDLATQNDETIEAETLPFLFSMFQVAQADTVSMLLPYLGRSETWDKRLYGAIRRIREWKTDEAVRLFEGVFGQAPLSDLKRFYQLVNLAKVNPHAGCDLIRLILDRALDERISVQKEKEGIRLHSFYNSLEILRGNTIVEALKITSAETPGYFMETMLPWLECVVRYSPELENEAFFFAPDALSAVWIKTPYVIQLQLNQSFIAAMTELSRIAPEKFRDTATRLESLPYSTPQRIMAHVYHNVAEAFTEEGVNFLTSDIRRLNLGDKEQYDSRQLITALLPHLTDEQLSRLETAILSFDYVRGYAGTEGLRARGLERLRLLQCLPSERLSTQGANALQELERKFPGVRASDDPSTIQGGLIGAPIPADVAAKMSDDGWLGAMEKYGEDFERNNPLKGGPGQQAEILLSQVKEYPDRFRMLAACVPLDAHQSYVRALINGLADSPAPAEMLFEVIRRFISVSDNETWGAICSSLEKRAHEGVPEDITRLLDICVRGPAGEDEIRWVREEERARQGVDGPVESDVYSGYYYSARGKAFRALMRILDHEGGERARLRKWELVEFAAADNSPSLLQAGAIEELTYLLSDDAERAISTFERLLHSRLDLLHAQYAEGFLYYGLHNYFLRLEPFIVAMMNESFENHRQRGAELACIAAISPRAMESQEAHERALFLAHKALTGEATWRRGAARVYSANITADESKACAEALTQLLDDEDEQVRGFASDVFNSLHEEHIYTLRSFLEAYASSSSLYNGSQEFAEYIWTHAPLDPAWSLSVIEIVLNNRRGDDIELYFAGGEELIRLVLRIYTDPTTNVKTRRQAMDAFDRLLERFTAPALKVLQDWDRR